MNSKKKFLYLKQNQATNYMARFSTKNNVFYGDIYNGEYGKCSIDITMPGEKKYVSSTQKLERLIYCILSVRVKAEIILSFEEIFGYLGISNSRKNKQILKRDLETLAKTNIDYNVNNPPKGYFNKDSSVKEKYKYKISGSFNMINGYFFLNSTHLKIEVQAVLLDMMKQWGGFHYPVELFKLNNKNSYHFAINDRIAELLGGKRDRARISVKSLYDVAVIAGMPTFEKLSYRHFSKQILNPFNEALNAGSFFYTWTYDKDCKNYYDWINNYINIIAVGEGIQQKTKGEEDVPKSTQE